MQSQLARTETQPGLRVARFALLLSVLLVMLASVDAQEVDPQDVDPQNMTDEEREAYRAKIRAESATHHRRMMGRVGVTTPDSLPPPSPTGRCF